MAAAVPRSFGLGCVRSCWATRWVVVIDASSRVYIDARLYDRLRLSCSDAIALCSSSAIPELFQCRQELTAFHLFPKVHLHLVDDNPGGVRPLRGVETPSPGLSGPDEGGLWEKVRPVNLLATLDVPDWQDELPQRDGV